MGIRRDIKRIRKAVEMMAVLELRVVERLQQADTGPLAGMDAYPGPSARGQAAESQALREAEKKANAQREEKQAQAKARRESRKSAGRKAEANPKADAGTRKAREAEASPDESRSASDASPEGKPEAEGQRTRDEAIALAREKVGAGADREEIFEILDEFKASSIGELAEKDIEAFCLKLEQL